VASAEEGEGVGHALADCTSFNVGYIRTYGGFAMLNSVAPFLTVDDLSVTLAFYRSKLAFDVLYAPYGVDARTLGFSLPCAAFGIDSTIFIDKCEGVAYQIPVSFGKVLAYATAHELGHVLLRSSEHTGTGLVRARWDRATWLRAAIRGIPIDWEQARRMRIELARDSAAR
jgi:hypothetical protein